MRLILRARRSDSGLSPSIFDTDEDGQVAVQGTELLDPEALAQLGDLPNHETVVLVPRELLTEYARLSREGPA